MGNLNQEGLEMELKAREPAIPACEGIVEKIQRQDKLLLFPVLSYLLLATAALLYYQIVALKVSLISLVLLLVIVVFLENSSRLETIIWVVSIGAVLCYILF